MAGTLTSVFEREHSPSDKSSQETSLNILTTASASLANPLSDAQQFASAAAEHTETASSQPSVITIFTSTTQTLRSAASPITPTVTVTATHLVASQTPTEPLTSPTLCPACPAYTTCPTLPETPACPAASAGVLAGWIAMNALLGAVMFGTMCWALWSRKKAVREVRRAVELRELGGGERRGV